MRNLTEQEIQDLESRGIKEGEVYHCPHTSMPFTLRSWLDFKIPNDGIGDINSKDGAPIGSQMNYAWLRCGTDYATPVAQPIPEVGTLDNTVREVYEPELMPEQARQSKTITSEDLQFDQLNHVPDGGKTIDWEARRWELATRLFTGPARDAKTALMRADNFIQEYRNTLQL